MNKNKALQNKKPILIKNKVKNNNTSSEYIKTESHKDLHKILLKEPKTKNIGQNSLYNLESYKPYDNEIYRGTLKPQYNNTNLKKAIFVDNKEKKSGSKKNNTKKEKEKQYAKNKKLVNFANNNKLLKQQKSERKLCEGIHEEDDDIELKLNKSVALFNKNDISDDNLEDNNPNIDNNINNNVIDDKNNKDNINKVKINDNNKEKRQPNLKIYKHEEEITKEESKKELNPKEDQNKIEIIELKSDNFQIKKVEINDEDINNLIKVDNNKDNENAKSAYNKKVSFNNDNENISPEKQMNGEINKEQNKSYLNTNQNSKKSNKTKKGNKYTSILKTEEPKSTKTATKTKISNAIKKVNIVNKTYKNKNLDKDFRQTMGIPFLQNLREEIMSVQKVPKGDKNALNDQNKSQKNLLQDLNIDDNINAITINNNNENYTGLILLKYNQGEKVKEIKLEGTIDNINDLLNREKIEINNKKVVLIDKNELEKLKRENEKFQNQFFNLKEDYDKQRELFKNNNINDNINNNDNVNNINNDNVNINNNNNVNEHNNNMNNNYENEKDAFLLFKKKTIEEGNNQMEEKNIKIKEIKERIQKYKEELKKGSNAGPSNERMSCRINYNKKEAFNIEQKMKEFEKKRENLKKEERKKQIENYENKTNIIATTIPNNNNTNKNIEDINYTEVIKKDKVDKVEKKENKEKDKNKGYSKALDRFKKRYKNHSMEIRTKKSERINEIAKNLENLIGKQQTSEIPDNKNITHDIINCSNSAEIIENQPLTAIKAKKPKKPQL